MTDKTELDELLEQFDTDNVEDALKKYEAIERQVAMALVEGIDGDADARMVQSILLTKVIGVALAFGMPDEKFAEIVSNTWQVVEHGIKRENATAVH